MISGTSVLRFALLLIFAGEISAQCGRTDIMDCVVFNDDNVKTFSGLVYRFDSTCGYKLVWIDAAGLEVSFLRGKSTLQVKYIGRTFDVVIKEDTHAVLTRDGVVQSIPASLNGVTVSKPGRMVIVEVKLLGMKIRFDGATVHVIQDNAELDVPMRGFCGHNNGCDLHELILPDGAITKSQVEFASDWALESCAPDVSANACNNERLMLQAVNYCSELFSKIQQVCWTHANYFFDVCTSSYCSCKLPNRDDCMCDILDALVKTCEVNTVSLVGWRSDNFCPVQCANPDQTFAPCAPDKVQLSCGEDDITDPTRYDCEDGCYCPSGMRLFQGKCLFAEECPCSYNDNWYNAGASIAQDCNTCTCRRGQWECTDKLCTVPGECSGDPHYITFDGRRFDFMGKCKYYVVRGIGFDVICDHYIHTANGFVKDFQSNLPSYCAKVIIQVQSDVIELGQKHAVNVNGAQIGWFPQTISGILISRPSSQFTEVALRNNVTVRWTGNNRIIVDIPTTMNGRVKGLFGTYNKNPSDDFTMPDGTLAPNANVFGHSWVVPGSCSPDVNTDPVQHPCEANPSKKPKAEERCGVIRSELFAGCSDDADHDYEDCVYDGCLCQDNDAKCFCDFFARQGEMCAAKGVLVDWRKTIAECAIECPKGQEYQVCGNSCTRSCEDISGNPGCTSRCVDGCNCPPGETLDNSNNCIPTGQCPCVRDGSRYPPDFTFIDTKEGSKHTCQNALWTVTSAVGDDKDKYPSILDLESKCNRQDFLTFSGCIRTNELTCLNKHLNERPIYDDCESGCQCTEGFLMDTELDMCVRPGDCPCIYKGVSYPDDAVVNDRDQRCVCVYGFWKCSPQTDHWEKCSVWGNVHVRTFDETVFSFAGSCEYVLFEHTFDSTGLFRVTLGTTSCNAGTCIVSAFVHYRAGDGRTENVVFATDSSYIATPNLSTLSLTDLDLSAIVDVADLGVRVVWNKAGWIHIHTNQVWLTRDHSGLCGKYDNDASNDLEIPGSQSTEVGNFVSYNKADSSCGDTGELTPIDAMLPDSPCNVLYSDVFKTCRLLRPVEEYFDRCIIDAEIQSNLNPSESTDYYCQTISAYAQECNDAGAPVDWRSQHVCPYTCPADKEYSPCEISCPQESCKTADEPANFCSERICSEACSRNAQKCADGEIYLDSSYKQCVTRDQCPA